MCVKRVNGVCKKKLPRKFHKEREGFCNKRVISKTLNRRALIMTRGSQGLKRKNNVMLPGEHSVVSEYEQVVLHGIVI